MTESANVSLFDEIRGQPARLAHALPLLRANVRDLDLPRLKPFGAVYLTGCGDASWLSQAARMAFEREVDAAVHALPAMEVSQYARLRAGDLVVLMSISGETQRTLEAMESARAAGSRTLAVTARVRSPLACGCDYVLILPGEAASQGTPHALNYTMTLLALYTLVEGLVARRMDGLDRVPDAMEATFGRSLGPSRAAAREVGASGQSWFFGAGPHWGTAQYAAALWWSAGGMKGQALELEDIAHGAHQVLRPRDLAVLIAPQGRSHARARELLSGLVELGAYPVLIGGEGSDVVGGFSLPVAAVGGDEVLASLTTAVATQLLCWATACQRGHDVVARVGVAADRVHRRWRDETIRHPRG